VVPVHSGDTIGPGLLTASFAIASLAEMTSSHCCSGGYFRASNFRLQPTRSSLCSLRRLNRAYRPFKRDGRIDAWPDRRESSLKRL
jgi:hypothetical protein